MPRPLQLNQAAPFAVKEGARLAGERLALARKRLTLGELAAKAGVSYGTAPGRWMTNSDQRAPLRRWF